jgi:SAM-dependent methyltransferase
VGCGDGLFFDRLAEFGEVEGVEPDKQLVNPESPHHGRIRTVPFDTDFQPSGSYSLVLMLDVLEHLDNPGDALRHAHSLLAQGGALLVTVPAFQILWTQHDVVNQHRVRYRRGTLRPLLRQAQFRILEERYWYQWTCLAKLAVRLIESVFPHPPSIAKVPPEAVNHALHWISRFEQHTLGRIGMPFGSSLMVYCVKQGAP